MNGRDYIIKANIFELGVLTGVIMQLDDAKRQALAEVWKQLMEFRSEIARRDGVTREVLPGGMLKLTDKDGNVIIREPYPFEIGGN